MKRQILIVYLVALCLVKCMAMSNTELQDFKNFLDKTSALDQTLKGKLVNFIKLCKQFLCVFIFILFLLLLLFHYFGNSNGNLGALYCKSSAIFYSAHNLSSDAL